MKFPHLLGRVTVAIGIVLGSLAAQATEFRSSDIHPDDYPTVLAVRHMGEVLSNRPLKNPSPPPVWAATI